MFARMDRLAVNRLHRLIAIAREEKLQRVISTILAENREMRAICQKLGFHTYSSLEDNMIRAELEL